MYIGYIYILQDTEAFLYYICTLCKHVYCRELMLYINSDFRLCHSLSGWFCPTVSVCLYAPVCLYSFVPLFASFSVGSCLPVRFCLSLCLFGGIENVLMLLCLPVYDCFFLVTLFMFVCLSVCVSVCLYVWVFTMFNEMLIQFSRS